MLPGLVVGTRKSARKRVQRCWPPVKRWLVDYGFAGLVVLALTGGVIAALNTEIPEAGLPSLAFRSELFYRLEIGGLAFLLGYLIVLAFVLALNGRGFAHIGPRGLKAEEVVNKTFKAQEANIAVLERGVARNRAVGELHIEAIGRLNEKIESMQEREDKLLEVLRRQQEALDQTRERLERLEVNLR